MAELKWEEVSPHPAQVVCVGDIGSGKSGLMANFMDYARSNGLQCWLVGSTQLGAVYPKWVKTVTPDHVQDVPNDSAICVDDAHLYFYARESMRNTEGVKALDFLGRERRHRNISLFINSQQCRVIDVNLLSMVSCVCVKKPSLMQIKFARPEFRAMLVAAKREFDKCPEEGIQKYVYVISGEEESMMTNSIPAWFKDETSTAYSGTNVKKPINRWDSVIRVVKSFG